ncbi:MAG: class I SAM-dependent methyltransferase [Thaumarchaeota archaeon]|nr:class I SAM-dependent methyltransferase [Nitrososphaerota archaeon]
MDRAEKVLAEIEEQSRKNPLVIIGPKRGMILDDAILKYKPKTVVEIGTLVGYSAIRMGRLIGPGRITCLEIDEEMARVARRNISDAGLGGVIDVRVGDARELLPKLEGIFDLVFIDAKKDQYLSYLKLVEPKIKRGGVVLADNVKRFASEMQDYLEYVRDSGRYKSTYIESESSFDPDGDAVEISIRR